MKEVKRAASKYAASQIEKMDRPITRKIWASLAVLALLLVASLATGFGWSMVSNYIPGETAMYLPLYIGIGILLLLEIIASIVFFCLSLLYVWKWCTMDTTIRPIEIEIRQAGKYGTLPEDEYQEELSQAEAEADDALRAKRDAEELQLSLRLERSGPSRSLPVVLADRDLDTESHGIGLMKKGLECDELDSSDSLDSDELNVVEQEKKKILAEMRRNKNHQ